MLSIGQATICHLTPCVKKYSFSVENGIPALRTLGDRYGSWYLNESGVIFSNGRLYDANTGQLSVMDIEPSWNDVVGKNGRLVNLGNISSPSNFSSVSYMISGNDLSPFSGLIDIFTGQSFFGEQFLVYQDFPITALDPGLLILHHVANQGDLAWAIPRIAGRLSKYFHEESEIQVPRKSYTVVAVAEVPWYWLSLPAITWIIGTGFLITAIWICHRDGQVLWKSSSLPLIYHGFDAEDLEAINYTATEIDKVSGMESFAKSLQARFRQDSVTGQLKLAKL
ncbi:hypothetical protein F4803DRAFT_577376 [Xylaria telfairii]|nr:hypothetical protein F4803DRAFT_577376 [Xylaria telfairii]